MSKYSLMQIPDLRGWETLKSDMFQNALIAYDSTKFTTGFKILLDENHREVSQNYRGRTVEVVAIALQDRSVAARICRLLIGILVTTATLGFSLCFKAVKDLFSRRCAVVVCTPCKQRKIGKDVRLAIHLTIVEKISMDE